jgi:hypothetical protein
MKLRFEAAKVGELARNGPIPRLVGFEVSNKKDIQ